MSGSSEATLRIPPLVSVREAVETVAKESGQSITYHQFVGWINRNRFELADHSTKIGHGIAILKSHLPKVIEELKKSEAQ